jgi:hypothetical protein
MTRTFTHNLMKEVQSISGWYQLDKEEKLEHGGKEYLYLVGNGVVDSSCCGVGGCFYAVVPGAILSWKSDTNEEGVETSELEPVADEETRAALR